MHELRFYRNGDELPHASPVRVVLNFDDVSVLEDLLNRHLIAAVERSGGVRKDAHLYHLEVREIDRWNALAQTIKLRWVLPIDPEEERLRWR
jgi:hypothetical protein